MAHEITIPRLGWNMDEGLFQGWLKKDGDTVRAGEAIFLLESEKATEEVECLEAGVLRIKPGGPKVGDQVAVGLVVGAVIKEGEDFVFSGTPSAKPPSELRPRVTVGQGNKVDPVPASREKHISPRARRVARELGVDWSTVQGSGRTGRIRERDVRAATTAKPTLTRRTIAERMRRSQENTSPVTLTTTADATNFVNLRQQFKAAGGDAIPSYTDFLVKLSAVALHKHPHMTVRWEGERLVPAGAIHIGVAVDTAAGLVVPVVRDVPGLGIHELASQSRALIERARNGNLAAADMQGGVFTLTNLGAFGIDAFTPIINYPECAILGAGRLQKLPIVVGDRVVPRDRITLSLTFDHRRVDGAAAAQFLQTLSQAVENPGPSLMQ